MSNELQNTSIELSDDDLESVAGGSGLKKHPYPVSNTVNFTNSGSNSGTQIGQQINF